MTTVEKRKAFIINAVYFAAGALAFYFFMKYAFGPFLPFILAFFTAIVMQRPLNYLTKKTPLKKGLLAVIFVVLFLAVAGIVVFFAGNRIVNELKGLFGIISVWLSDLSGILSSVKDWLIKLIGYLPTWLGEPVSAQISAFFEGLSESLQSAAAQTGETGGLDFTGIGLSWLKDPLSSLWSTAKQVPNILLTVFISIVSCIFMIIDYDEIVDFIRRQLPEERRHVLSAAKRHSFKALGNYLKANAILMSVAFVEMIIELNFLRAVGIYTGGYILAISFITAILDFLPVVGIGTILMPWAVIEFLIGNYKMGVCLVVMYIIGAGIRQFIEPKVYSASLGIPPIVSLLSIYLGLNLFGLPGLILLPIFVTLLKALNDEGIVKLWKTVPDGEAGILN